MMIFTDTMHICFDCIGHLEVDDQTNVLHVDTTAGQISGYKDMCLAAAQSL